MYNIFFYNLMSCSTATLYYTQDYWTFIELQYANCELKAVRQSDYISYFKTAVRRNKYLVKTNNTVQSSFYHKTCTFTLITGLINWSFASFTSISIQITTKITNDGSKKLSITRIYSNNSTTFDSVFRKCYL